MNNNIYENVKEYYGKIFINNRLDIIEDSNNQKDNN